MSHMAQHYADEVTPKLTRGFVLTRVDRAILDAVAARPHVDRAALATIAEVSRWSVDARVPVLSREGWLRPPPPWGGRWTLPRGLPRNLPVLDGTVRPTRKPRGAALEMLQIIAANPTLTLERLESEWFYPIWESRSLLDGLMTGGWLTAPGNPGEDWLLPRGLPAREVLPLHGDPRMPAEVSFEDVAAAELADEVSRDVDRPPSITWSREVVGVRSQLGGLIR
ncbi:MAG: hypothetical protein GC150_17255 [Rhizobiales bacterium]|nr:hypothetical protein [Hyphomicrobiales bacterium]